MLFFKIKIEFFILFYFILFLASSASASSQDLPNIENHDIIIYLNFLNEDKYSIFRKEMEEYEKSGNGKIKILNFKSPDDLKNPNSTAALAFKKLRLTEKTMIVIDGHGAPGDPVIQGETQNTFHNNERISISYEFKANDIANFIATEGTWLNKVPNAKYPALHITTLACSSGLGRFTRLDDLNHRDLSFSEHLGKSLSDLGIPTYLISLNGLRTTNDKGTMILESIHSYEIPSHEESLEQIQSSINDLDEEIINTIDTLEDVTNSLGQYENEKDEHILLSLIKRQRFIEIDKNFELKSLEFKKIELEEILADLKTRQENLVNQIRNPNPIKTHFNLDPNGFSASSTERLGSYQSLREEAVIKIKKITEAINVIKQGIKRIVKEKNSGTNPSHDVQVKAAKDFADQHLSHLLNLRNQLKDMEANLSNLDSAIETLTQSQNSMDMEIKKQSASIFLDQDQPQAAGNSTTAKPNLTTESTQAGTKAEALKNGINDTTKPFQSLALPMEVTDSSINIQSAGEPSALQDPSSSTASEQHDQTTLSNLQQELTTNPESGGSTHLKRTFANPSSSENEGENPKKFTRINNPAINPSYIQAQQLMEQVNEQGNSQRSTDEGSHPIDDPNEEVRPPIR